MNPVFITFCLGLLLNSCMACEDKYGHSHDDHHPCFVIKNATYFYIFYILCLKFMFRIPWLLV